MWGVLRNMGRTGNPAVTTDGIMVINELGFPLISISSPHSVHQGAFTSSTMQVGPFTVTNTANTERDSVLIKMATSNGQPLWATSWGSSGGLDDALIGLAVDSKNNVIATGREVEHPVVFCPSGPPLTQKRTRQANTEGPSRSRASLSWLLSSWGWRMATVRASNVHGLALDSTEITYESTHPRLRTLGG